MTQQQHKHWLKLGHSEFELVVPLSPSRSLPTCHCSSENQHWILLRLGDIDDQRRGVFFTMLPITPQSVKVNFYTILCKNFHRAVKLFLLLNFTFFNTL